MANVAHSSLTGSELHEPKGAATATVGQVYVADGAGSGNWATISTSAFTGMIADFAAPVAPSGWLELDGSVISTSTYASLFSVVSIASSGTRINGDPVITSVPSTTNFKVGYYVFGVGIVSGSTIVSIDSATQITISNGATSPGTSTLYVSPWLMNTGTITLPNLTAAGRYRRSRTSSTKVGDLLSDQNQAHTHTGSGTTSAENVSHTHSYSGTTAAEAQAHTHGYSFTDVVVNSANDGTNPTFLAQPVTPVGANTGTQSANHTHTYSGTTGGISTNHTHTYSFTSSSNGGTEARPTTMVVLTCIKT